MPPFKPTPLSRQALQTIYLYHRSRTQSLPIPPTALPPLFKACAALQSLPHGAALHADAIKLGLHSHTSTANSIANFYFKCGLIHSALQLFRTMPAPDSVSWNMVIHGLLTKPEYVPALRLFADAVRVGFSPNVSTLLLLIHACWRVQALNAGLCIHGFLLQSGYVAFLEIRNSLLSFYVKCSHFTSAEAMFDEMPERDVISWSVMMSGYVESGRGVGALRVFRTMCGDSQIDVDGLAVVGVLQACSDAGSVEQGRLIHGSLIRRGFGGDLFVGNSLIDMYSKCLDVGSAGRVIGEMLETNIVSWNCLLSGLVRNEKYVEALDVFRSMKEVDEVTTVNLLQVCKRLGQATWCRCIHSVIIQRQFATNVYVLNALLDAYAKCDLMELALKIFEQMEEKNLISWCTMIAGFGHCGQPDEAVAFFREMMLVEGKASAVAMLSLLDACAVSAELKRSKSAHAIAIRNHLASELAVSTALLHMYAKCGDVNASKKVFCGMPERNVLTWNAMIGALGTNGCAQEAHGLLQKMESENIKPNGVTMLSLLSACSHGGLVEEGLSLFQRMMEDPMLQPAMEHYSCIIDMLGRAGYLKSASEAIKGIPEGMEAGPAAWGALLSACRSQGDWELGQGATSRVLELEPLNAAGYLLSSNLYAKGGSQDDIARMRLLMRQRGVKVTSGYSLVHIDQKSYKFVAWDATHPEFNDIYFMVKMLHTCIKRDRKNSCATT